jgi:hypothetical protein
MELAGVGPERIVEIGPLRYDALLRRPAPEPVADPRRIVFASQPAPPCGRPWPPPRRCHRPSWS